MSTRRGARATRTPPASWCPTPWPRVRLRGTSRPPWWSGPPGTSCSSRGATAWASWPAWSLSRLDVLHHVHLLHPRLQVIDAHDLERVGVAEVGLTLGEHLPNLRV